MTRAAPRPLAPVTLRGSHVRLEPLEPHHTSELWPAANEPGLWTHMGADGSTRSGLDDWIANRLADRDQGAALPFLTRDAPTGAAIGSTSLFDYHPTHRRIEIGHTWFARAHRGTHANPEAKLLLLTHAFDVLRVERVQLKTDPANQRSRRAILRLGATEEGLLRHYVTYADGTPHDRVMFSILRADYPRVRDQLLARLKVPASPGDL